MCASWGIGLVLMVSGLWFNALVFHRVQGLEFTSGELGLGLHLAFGD